MLFKDKIEREAGTECWLWRGSTHKTGYGQVMRNYKNLLAHRAVYEDMRGTIPKGLTLDHLCRNRRCVNPDHLEIVTRGENVLREDAGSSKRSQDTMRGHPFDAANTYHYMTSRGRPARNCRACRRKGAK